MNQATGQTGTVHDLYVDRINALLARGLEDEANELAVEFEAESTPTGSVTALAPRTFRRPANRAA
jgi:hypothetical protein